MENLVIVNRDELREVVRDMVSDIIDLAKLEERNKIRNEETFLSMNNVCEMASISRQTVLRKTRDGILKDYGVGNRHKYKKSEILDALESGKLSRRIRYTSNR